jgi:hypothetical protein
MIVTLTGSHNSGCISEKVKLHTALLLLQEVFATKYLSVLPIFLHANISVEGTRLVLKARMNPVKNMKFKTRLKKMPRDTLPASLFKVSRWQGSMCLI